mmetsp:Transcript_16879/g.40339  ORF Transcript_16879/g.40339 Transcript_16879/m.40339 type:complete len:750 (-) Transcript_16879:156-2405(-)
MNNITASLSGDEACSCIDQSATLSALLVDRSCELPNGQIGLQTIIDRGPCVPQTYGSGGCLRHDLLHNPVCKADLLDEFCLRPWCFVDAAKCRQSSTERVFRSDYFPRDADMFYSYSTCGASEDGWVNYANKQALGGLSISAIIPAYSDPMMYKRNSSDHILLTPGDEYYLSSVPYEGVFMIYLNNLMEISDGDFSINYTYASKAGKIVHPSSSYTAAIQDVGDGLADMVVGQTWVTSQRLAISSFTEPLYYDKTVLAIPKPSEDKSLATQTQKVLQPFTYTAWGLIAVIIASTALVSVWFAWFGKIMPQRKLPNRREKMAYVRLAIDECLRKGIFFCSAGVEQDQDGTLPQKLLSFGFAFFILIVVSAYVANLAAFLTRPVQFVGTIETVREMNMQVCAHPALQDSLQVAWPEIRFVFPNNDYHGMLDAYKKGECDVLAVSSTDVTTTTDVLQAFCDAGFVLTESLVIENAIAFATRPDLASALSYWMHLGKMSYGITFEAAQEEYDKANQREPMCDLKLSLDGETGDYAQIHPENLLFPFLFFASFAGLAILVQICHQRNLKKSKKAAAQGISHLSLFGRQSTMAASVFRSAVKDCKDNNAEFAEINAITTNIEEGSIMVCGSMDGDENNDCLDKSGVSFSGSETAEKKGVGFSDTGLAKTKSIRFVDAEPAETRFCDGNSDDFEENRGSTIVRSLMTGDMHDFDITSPENAQYDATSRLQQLIAQTSTFGEILECLNDIKRQEGTR